MNQRSYLKEPISKDSSMLPVASNRRAIIKMLGGALAAATAGSVRAQGGNKTIRVGLHKAMVYTPALLLGQYMPDWKIELSYFNAPGDLTTALMSNSLDVAYTGLTIAALARAKGQPIVVVSNAAERGSAIMVKTKSDIRSVADLRGKSIGTQPGGIQDALLREELKKAGVAIDQVTVIRLAYPEMPLALQRGDVDAYSGNEPVSTQAVRDGYARVLIYPYDNAIGSINGGILTTENVVSQRADMLRGLTAAHARAAEMLQQSPDDWAGLVSREWGFDRETIRRAVSNVDLRWRMNDEFLTRYAAYMSRLKDLGVIPSIPDINKVVNRDFVRLIKS